MCEFINFEDQILKIGMPTWKLKLLSLEKLKKQSRGSIPFQYCKQTTITIIILDDGDVDDNTPHDDAGDDTADNRR